MLSGLTNRDQGSVNRISCGADAWSQGISVCRHRWGRFPKWAFQSSSACVVAIDPVDLYISQMPPDSVGQSVADQSFKFVGGHRRPFHGSPP
jgi:hypothetical protein